MKILKLFVILVGLTGFPAFGGQPTKESVIEMMQITGTEQMAGLMYDQLIPLVKLAAPDAPQGFWEEFQSNIDLTELIDRLAPVYQKHFTQAEIDKLIEFYNSDIGKKFINSQPVIYQESNAIGVNWAKELVSDALKKLN